jgi:molecular chaperone GrpE (heat shock protein)
LIPVWRQTKTQALEKYGSELLAILENLESAIERKTSQSEVNSIVDKGANLLQRDFGIACGRSKQTVAKGGAASLGRIYKF